MKILILSHTRCGSTTLCKWLSNELNIELDESPYNKKTFNSIFEKTDIIRKIVIEEYLPPNDIINKFDKVICLTRENSIDTAISFIVANETDDWHVSYEVTSEWIYKNKKQILEEIYRYQKMKSNMKKYDGFQTTYEGIYVNKSDINKVLKYMNIDSPKYLDMLDYDKKYRKDNNVFIKTYNGII